jgi:hypothetical protein
MNYTLFFTDSFFLYGSDTKSAGFSYSVLDSSSFQDTHSHHSALHFALSDSSSLGLGLSPIAHSFRVVGDMFSPSSDISNNYKFNKFVTSVLSLFTNVPLSDDDSASQSSIGGGGDSFYYNFAQSLLNKADNSSSLAGLPQIQNKDTAKILFYILFAVVGVALIFGVLWYIKETRHKSKYKVSI